MSRFYLLKLWKHSRLLFTLIILFILLQTFFTYKGVETLPFFNYGMYSHYFSQKETYSTPVILIDDQYLNEQKMPEYTVELVYTSLQNYLKLQSNIPPSALPVFQDRFKGKVSPEIYSFFKKGLIPSEEKIADYPEWLWNYLQDYYGKKISRLTIEHRHYEYSDGTPLLIKKNKIFTLEQP